MADRIALEQGMAAVPRAACILLKLLRVARFIDNGVRRYRFQHALNRCPTIPA